MKQGTPFVILGKDIATDLLKHIDKILNFMKLNDQDSADDLLEKLEQFLDREQESHYGKASKAAYMSDLTETTHALLSEYYNQLRTIKSKYKSKWDIPELSELPTKLRDDYNPKFLGSVSIPLEQARLLQGKTITTLFIGRIPDAKIIRDFSSSEATIKSPIEFYSSSKGLPFEVHRIIYYVLETGEILGSVDIPYDSIDTLINQ